MNRFSKERETQERKKENKREKTRESEAGEGKKNKRYFKLLEDAREIRDLYVDIEKLKKEALRLAKEEDLSKAKEKANVVDKKKRKRSMLIEDFSKKHQDLRGKIPDAELEGIEDFAFSSKSKESKLRETEISLPESEKEKKKL